MAKTVIVRGNTIYFSFRFYDENDNLAVVDSAALQLTWPGATGFETETIALQQAGDDWVAEWDSAAMRPGWLHYHAHALDQGYQIAHDGRVRVTGNRASLDHDRLRAARADYSESAA